jgi:DNA-binding transcriptional LysR family regulator
MNLELRSLRHAVTLGRRLNYRQAAEELGITQSTLTRSIQTIEREVKARLFDRDRAGVSLTPLGREFVRRAEAVLQSAQDMSEMMVRAAGGEAGAVAFGMGPLVAKAILPGLLEERLKRNPDLHATVTVRNSGELMPLLLSEEIEFFVAAASPVAAPARVRATVLGQFPVSLLVRPNHPLLTSASRAQLGATSFPLIASSVRELPHQFPPDVRSRIGPVPSLVTDDHQLLSLLSQSTDAVWLSSSFAGHAEILAGTLVTLPAGDGPQRRFPVVKYSLEGRSQSPAAGKLITAVRSRIRRMEAAIEEGVMRPVDQIGR